MDRTVFSDEEGQSISQLGADGNAESEFKNDKKSPEIYSLREKFHNKTFTETEIFEFPEAIDLNIQGCTFEEDVNFVIYKDALIDWQRCTFKKSLCVNCLGKAEFNIQNCLFDGNSDIIISKNSSLRFEENCAEKNLTILTYEQIDLMIKNCQVLGETTLYLRDETVLKCEANFLYKTVQISILGEAKATFRKNIFLNDNAYIFQNDSIFTFEANQCMGKFESDCYGKIDSTIERNIIQNGKFLSNDTILRFSGNKCSKQVLFYIQGTADVNIQNCMFFAYSALAIQDKVPISLQKNLCVGETLFDDSEDVKLVVEKNGFHRSCISIIEGSIFAMFQKMKLLLMGDICKRYK